MVVVENQDDIEQLAISYLNVSCFRARTCSVELYTSDDDIKARARVLILSIQNRCRREDLV